MEILGMEIGLGTIIIVAVLVYLILVYNLLIAKRNRVKKNFERIGISLQQRFDELNSLREDAYGDLITQGEFQKEIAAARSGFDIAKETNNINGLVDSARSLGNLGRSMMGRMENPPKFETTEGIMHVLKRATSVENDLKNMRTHFNSSATSFNTALEVFPTVIFAKIMGFKQFDLWIVKEEAKERPVSPARNMIDKKFGNK